MWRDTDAGDKPSWRPADDRLPFWTTLTNMRIGCSESAINAPKVMRTQAGCCAPQSFRGLLAPDRQDNRVRVGRAQSLRAGPAGLGCARVAHSTTIFALSMTVRQRMI